jgi:hypothetical protein
MKYKLHWKTKLLTVGRDRRKRLSTSPIQINGDVAYINIHIDGKLAIIDSKDVELIKEELWVYSKCGVRRSKSPQCMLHRVILGLDEKDTQRVDHINGDILDNRRCNLRCVNASQNGFNRIRKNTNNTSGVTGVSRNKKRWSAHIYVMYKKIHIGTFDTIEEAAKERRAAELKYFREFAPHAVTIQKSPTLGEVGATAPMVYRKYTNE